ncbi:MAG: twin-arginine translocation pathway signal protein [Candidatus Dormiibacter spiritus]|nr:MAG: twin-arginine translocation pathway signal protein [Candidatus Dormibacteraeota bacterium]
MNRRQFLRTVGWGVVSTPVLLTLLTSCAGPGAGQPPRTSPGRPSPTPKRPPNEADWNALKQALSGGLLRPGDSGYDSARLLYNQQFDSVRPAALARCRAEADVQSTLSFAGRFAVGLAVRSGGHSYAGYSTGEGLVLDLSSLNSVNVDAAQNTATIEPGATLIDAYAKLASTGLALPGGSCPTVGVAGLALGGGVGVLGRKYGLLCDNLLSARVVTADGRVLNCDASHEPDLFWALRGGGGGNFGVVTSFTFRVFRQASVATLYLEWPWSLAGQVVTAWQSWAPGAPDELWSNCVLGAKAEKGAAPSVSVSGVYCGGSSALNPLAADLVRRIAAPPTARSLADRQLLPAMLLEAGCFGKTVEQCQLADDSAQGTLKREAFSARSDYFNRPLPQAGVDLLVGAITRRQADPALAAAGIGLDAYGGAINRMAPEATAFVHRTASFSAQYDAYWPASAGSAGLAANRRWLGDLWQSLRPYTSGKAYQNYIDPELSDWSNAYYGANLARLRKVKAAYDPNGLFRFSQAIPAPG